MTDPQTMFNIAVAIIGFAGGWIMNNIRDSIKALHDADALLSNKVQTIEVLVAGKYVTRDDFVKLSDALFAKLDRIEQKVDGKVDKSDASLRRDAGVYP